MNNDTQFLASGHSLKKISSKISSLQATKDNQLEYWELLTQEIKKGDKMNKET